MTQRDRIAEYLVYADGRVVDSDVERSRALRKAQTHNSMNPRSWARVVEVKK